MKPATPASRPFVLPYRVCRNISSPEDEKAGRKTYSGHVAANAILDLEDDANVREYLVGESDKSRRTTPVHRAIRETLENSPDDFSILNGGVVIVASGASVDDKARVLILQNASIINGSQTQGELRRHFQGLKDSHTDFQEDDIEFNPSVRFEIIVTANADLVGNISIARNFQNTVRALSMAGRRSQLEELEAAFEKALPGKHIRTRDSDGWGDEGFVDTEKLLQVVFALMPKALFAELGIDSKSFAYSNKSRCLKTFQLLHEKRAAEFKRAYRYCLDIVGPAWSLYNQWKSHAGFEGCRLRAIKREAGRIVDVPDGIVFPILAALSAFVVKTNKGWVYAPPPRFREQVLVDMAVNAYKDLAGSNPSVMGKLKACYAMLAPFCEHLAEAA